MDAAACIGCGACVAACPNASAMLFVAAKASHLNLLPQGQPERDRRVVAMVDQMDAEGFGNCTNHAECEAACPKEISIEFIARLNRDYLKASFFSRVLPRPPGGGPAFSEDGRATRAEAPRERVNPSSPASPPRAGDTRPRRPPQAPASRRSSGWSIQWQSSRENARVCSRSSGNTLRRAPRTRMLVSIIPSGEPTASANARIPADQHRREPQPGPPPAEERIAQDVEQHRTGHPGSAGTGARP